jgi:hypothetical protein
MAQKDMAQKNPKKKQNKGEDEPKAFGPRSMEKMMQDLQRLLSQQEFESIEEANAFLGQFTGKQIPEMPVPDDPLLQAQDLVYQAYEAPSRKQAVKLARQALERSPDCADAYVLLAEADANTLEEARAYYEQGVEAGAALEEAIECNPHVPAYLLGDKKLPKQMPAYVGFGDENEAVDYASAGIANWRTTQGAVRWLRRHAGR